jgi:hypothetical protein
VCKLTDHPATGIVLADERALPVNLPPLGRVEDLDHQPAVTSPGRTDPHREFIGSGAQAGWRGTEQLAEAVSFRCGARNEFVEIAQLGQQRLERPADAVAGAQGQQVFGAGVQVVDDAIGIDTDDRRGDAAEDVGELRWRSYGWTLGRGTGGSGLTVWFALCWEDCCT